jgi:hypothetical protein
MASALRIIQVEPLSTLAYTAANGVRLRTQTSLKIPPVLERDMQGFLFSCPRTAGPGRSLVPPGPVVVAYEPLASSGGQRAVFSWPVDGSGWGAPAPFRVVLLYEDLALGKRARRASRILTAQAGQGVWRCESLQDRHSQRRAAAQVARADLVILSVWGALPASTGALLGAWLEGKRCRDSALVAMVDGAGAPAANAGGSPLVRLARLARRHGLNCVQERFEVPEGPGRGRWEVVWVF